MKTGKSDKSAFKSGRRKTSEPHKKPSAPSKIGELNAMLAAIVESSDDAIVGSDLDGSITSWNAGAESIYGYTAEETIGRPISILASPAQAEEMRQMLERIQKGNKVEHYDTVHIKKDGTLINISLNLSPIKDASGTVIGASAVARDITRQKMVEHALQESEEKLRLFLEYCPVYMFFKDDKIRAIQLSRNYEKLLGRPLNELLGKTMNDLFPSELARSMIADDIRILQEGKPLEVEEEFNGRFYSTLKFPIIKDGKPRFLAGFTADITERKKAEEVLKLNEDRLVTLLKLTVMKITSEDEIADFALEEAVRLTRSKGGYLHFFNEDDNTIQLYLWSRDALKTCTASRNEHYPLDKAGMWADSVRLRRPVIHNDYQNLPDKQGYPENHFHLIRHLGVPIFDGDRVVGVAGVGNKEDLYNEMDAMQINLFMNSLWTILKRKRAEETMRRLNIQKEMILNAAGEGILGLDVRGNHIFVNAAAVRMLGYDASEMINRNCHSMWHHTRPDGSPYPIEECPICEVFKTGAVNHKKDEVFWRKDGTSFPVSYTSTPVTEGLEVVGAVVTFFDITESKFFEEELKRLAMTDKLTGVFNRTKFDEIISREIELVRRYGQSLSMIMFDIDHFKRVNDSYGHITGDHVLKTLTAIVMQYTRKADYFLRWGGEEFIILSTSTSLKEEIALAERLRLVIEGHRFESAGQVTASFGVTDFRMEDTEDTFIKRADDALYLAKTRGRNRVEAL